MKNLDIVVVRFLPFILFAIIGNEIICSFMMIDLSNFHLLHSNSALYSSGLYGISYSNKRFHCKYNRYMLLFLIFTPILNYLDSKFCIFPSELFYLQFVIIAYLATLVVTSYLAVDHFAKAVKRRKFNNGLQNDSNFNFEATRKHE